MSNWNEFHGPNAGYILELYDQYRQDPESVDKPTRAFFETWQPPAELSSNGHVPRGEVNAGELALAAETHTALVMAAVNLANDIREYGHLAATIDPLGISNPPGDPSLRPASHGLTDDDLHRLPASVIGGPVAVGAADAYEAITRLRAVYCSTIGYDYDHIRIHEERAWLRESAEAGRFRPPIAPIDPIWILNQLTETEAFELFLHRVFPGKTRFSIEGLDVMVPMLNVFQDEAAKLGTYAMLMGMAHRGRLNVLAHVLGKPYEDLLREFRDSAGESHPTQDYIGWSGDVKYHAGASRSLAGESPTDMVVKMAPNPSHLEHINPVVAGMARAAGTSTDHPGRPYFDPSIVLPVVIHGDAAFPSQGIVAETLNLQRLRGYRIGGTIHIIANNQIGFTTSQWEGRSMLYASDLAKGFKMPIVHVNADDPEACIEVARLAGAYRARFHTDFVIDLVGYRRYGHNEGDEPRFTQPLMYRAIDAHPSARRLWVNTLAERGITTEDTAEEDLSAKIGALTEVYESLPPEPAPTQEPQLEPPPKGAAKNVDTTVPLDLLKELNAALLELPANFHLNKKLKRVLERRREASLEPEQSVVDWATAESLAFATVLSEGTAIRLTGEDVERGTFGHRHALLRDEENGNVYIPLQSIPQSKAAFEVRNSPLSENAAVGFEYGYNVQAPQRLVLWEAQYGDFVNGAQAVIDEFLVSGSAKWEQTSSLVMLLPHGHEGQGPDHSTGRPERFLQMAAETNMRVANATTSAQFYHLLRRQAQLLTLDPLPLIVMTPKSLLRNPLAQSSLRELAEGAWQPVIDDALVSEDRESVGRLILCSGKVYIDLISDERRDQKRNIAIARLEQLYPVRVDEIRAMLAGYPKLKELVWLQEEPANAGAWDFLRPYLEELVPGKVKLDVISRRRRASPAEGSTAAHVYHQVALLDRAFDFKG